MMNSLILAVSVFYPAVTPVWEKEPLTQENTVVPPRPLYMADETVAWQKDFYRACNDPGVKSSVALSLMKANNPEAVKTLMGLLQTEKDPAAAEDLLVTLAGMGADAENLRPDLLRKYFDSPSARTRALAMALCVKAGDSSSVLGALEKEQTPWAAGHAWAALAEKAESCPEAAALKFLGSPLPESRAGAAAVLAGGKNDPDSLPELMKAAGGGTPALKAAAARALANRAAGGDALSALLAEDKSAPVRALAASRPPGGSEKRTDALLKLLSDPEPDVRACAAKSLGGEKAERVCQALFAALKDSSGAVRAAAEKSLLKSAPPQASAEPALTALLGDKNAAPHAAALLGDFKISGAAGDLLKTAAAPDSPATAPAIASLGKLVRKDACQAIIKKSESKSPAVRTACAMALGPVNEPSARKTLEALAVDKDRKTAFEALRSMGLTADPAFTPCLLKVIKDNGSATTPDMRSAACWSLAKINAPGKDVTDALKTVCLKKTIVTEMDKMYDSDYVRTAAALSMASLGWKSPDCAKEAADAITKLKSPPLFDESFNNPALKDFAAQAELFMNKKPLEKTGELESEAPQLAAGKCLKTQDAPAPEPAKPAAPPKVPAARGKK